MRETSVERRLIELVKAAGGMCVKIPAIVAGVPDRLVILPGNRLYLIETKAPGGRVRPAQRVWHAKAARRGVEVAILWNSQMVADWLRDKEDPEVAPLPPTGVE